MAEKYDPYAFDPDWELVGKPLLVMTFTFAALPVAYMLTHDRPGHYRSDSQIPKQSQLSLEITVSQGRAEHLERIMPDGKYHLRYDAQQNRYIIVGGIVQGEMPERQF